jgi:hypothetical protein
VVDAASQLANLKNDLIQIGQSSSSSSAENSKYRLANHVVTQKAARFSNAESATH